MLKSIEKLIKNKITFLNHLLTKYFSFDLTNFAYAMPKFNQISIKFIYLSLQIMYLSYSENFCSTFNKTSSNQIKSKTADEYYFIIK